ncbi:MnhB domain-containing protein [Terricaulis sp.]|uniref:MnhB domain-containing protein n=1 Tax=Terricaulis sp. TaxID=2768686 RepID=UPI00378389D4
MKPGANISLGPAARFYAPLIFLFALSLLVARAPGGGIGFVAGLAAGLTVVVHMLVFGAAAARRALPPTLARIVLVAGFLAAVAGAGAPNMRFAPQVLEAGLFLTTFAGFALALSVLVGRVPALRDEEY